MNLQVNLLRGIYALGWEKPSYVQQHGILPVLNSEKDVIVQAQSGTGKTATFTIVASQIIDINKRQVQVVILNPTRELADQTLKVLVSLTQYMKINIVGVIGGKRLTNSQVSNAQIIVATPGRLYDQIERGNINISSLKLFIIDEADQMLCKGFKEQIVEIFNFMSEDTQIAIYSATMPPDIIDLTKKFMTNPIKILVRQDQLTLEGITQFYIGVDSEQDKYDSLCDIYAMLTISQSMIYCSTKPKVEWLTSQMEENGFPVGSIHGDMTQEERDISMKSFRDGLCRVLITTDLLARGIDVQQVSLVINYDLPNNKENYIHRIGRSGRYGRKGVAINFVMNQYDAKELQEIEMYYETQIKEMPLDISAFM